MTAVHMDHTYDQNSGTQKHWSAPLSEFMWTALSSCTAHSSVTIADFGVATGLNSCKFFKPLLEQFRAISDAPVQLYHTDRPENHWSAVFANIGNSADSYQSVRNVYSFAAGQSFYKQNFPPNYLDIAYSSTAFHWLPQPFPINLLSQSPETDPLLFEYFRKELTAQLRLRAIELKPAGHFIFNLVGSPLPSRTMFQPLIEVAVEMREAGLIPAGYLQNFPTPLVNDLPEANSAVVKSLREFELLETKIVTEEFPISQQYRETGDLETYAKAFAGFSKGYLYPYFKGICTQGEEGEALIQLFFTKVENHIRARPDPINVTQCYFHLRKIAS